MFHCYLILTNQTTHEIYHKASLPYLHKFKEMRREFLEKKSIKIPATMPNHPFDCGLKKNIRFVYYNSKQ